MFAVVQTPVKLSLLSLKPEAHATELLSSLWERGKNKSMQLILGRAKRARTCSSFWEEWEATLSLSLYL
jgi:outer membrane PBP1 activator LpoA protein